MATTIFILVFCGLILWLLHRLAVPQVHTVTHKWTVLAFDGFLTLLLLFNALFSFLGRGGLLLAIETPPVTTLGDLQRAGVGENVILVGRIGPENAPLLREYVAYFEDDLRSPVPLWIDLGDGSAAIANTTYAQRNWPFAQDASTEIAYLQAYYPVVVTGYVEHSAPVVGVGGTSPAVVAELVYSGSHDDFVAQARRRLIAPTALLGLSLAGALVAVVLAAMAWRRIDLQIQTFKDK